MLTHAHRVELEKNDGIMLLQGEKADGAAFFVYMIMNLEQVEKLERDSADGAVIDFAQYGTVIIAGKGKPTQDHIAYMEKEYNFKHPESEEVA